MADGKVAIVTGAGTGVGKAVAITLVKAGWKVAFCGRREDVLKDAVAAAGGDAIAVPCDVTKEDQVDALVARTVGAFGRLDMLFNNAGMSYPSTLIDEIPVDAWQKMVDINLTGSFLCARAAFRQFRAQKPQGGRIINNGSISATVPRPGSIPYTATKHAISGLTRTLALDGRPFNIACGQIDIGNAATEMTEGMTKGVPQANGTMAVEPRMDVQHVGDAVLHMASLPLQSNVLFMTIMATNMPYVGRG